MCFSQNYLDKFFLTYITPIHSNEMNASFSDTCLWVWEKGRRFTLSVEMPSIDLCILKQVHSQIPKCLAVYILGDKIDGSSV